MRGAAPQRAWADQWILDTLVRAGDVAAQRAEGAEADSAWDALVAAGVPEQLVLETACHVAGCRPADLSVAGPEHAPLLPAATARRYHVVPIGGTGTSVDVACANPLRIGLEQELGFASGKRIRLHVASPEAIGEAIAAVYGGAAPPRRRASSQMVPLPAVRAEGTEPGVRSDPRQDTAFLGGKAGQAMNASAELLDRVVGDALAAGASDIHLEPTAGGELIVRFRVDGEMYEARRVSGELAPQLVSRFKVTAGLDIADRVRPQDGRVTATFDGREVDMRVSTLPLGIGEKIVARVLDTTAGSTVALDTLGFTPGELHRIRRQLTVTEGMVLVTGPTGSGKTTTLYSVLRAVQTPKANIVTVEDPIEYRLDGINQVQVNDKAGLTFATSLRSILRQDPDIVMVGEIRDLETAAIAVRASMTGHLVLSTLHTNDAPSVVQRLLDIGVEAGALASALKVVVAQRLVRRLCRHCSQPVVFDDLPPEHKLLLDGKPTSKLRRAVGCDECRGGYRGRMVIAEVLVVTPDLIRAIARMAEVDEVLRLARQGGMKTMWEAGLERVVGGHTSLHELLDTIAAPLPEEVAAQGEADPVLEALRQASGPAPKAAEWTPPPRRERPHAPHPAFLMRAERPDGPERSAQPPQGCRVLIVDDDRHARRALRRELEARGYRCLEAADGEAAMSYVMRLSPDVVVTELAMPRLDGIGLLQAMADEAPHVRALVCSTERDQRLAEWARELGAWDVVPKRAGVIAVADALAARVPPSGVAAA